MVYDKEYHRQYQAQRYRERRAAALMKLGGICVECRGSKGLEFHHLDPDTKVIAVTVLFSKYSQAEIDRELDKCILLCQDCHAKVSAKQRSVEHGEGLTGKKGCRCELCGPLKRAYEKKYNDRRDRRKKPS